MYLSFLTMFPARLHGHLKSRCDPMHNQRSSVQKYRYFNQFISNHLKDFILDDIQTINFLPSRLYYDSVHIAIIEKASSRFDCEQSLPFLLRHFIMRAISPPFLHL